MVQKTHSILCPTMSPPKLASTMVNPAGMSSVTPTPLMSSFTVMFRVTWKVSPKYIGDGIWRHIVTSKACPKDENKISPTNIIKSFFMMRDRLGDDPKN